MKYVAVGMVWIGYAGAVTGVSYFASGTNVIVVVAAVGAFFAFLSTAIIVEN